MIIKQLTLATLDTGTLDFGFVGENEHIWFSIKCDSVFDEYPTAIASLLIKAPDNTIYPKTVEVEGYNVGWVITASDTAYPGSGQIQLTFTEDGAVVKTVIANTNVKDSLVGDDPPPDPIADWISNANQILNKVDGMTATAESLPSGDDPSVTVETVDGHYNLEFGIPAGDPGDPTEIIDDNAGVGDTTKVWSANKSATDLSELKSAIDSKAPVILRDASGDIVSITDGADGMPLAECVVSVTAVQKGTGDPSPTNVRAITGRTKTQIFRTAENLMGGTALRDSVLAAVSGSEDFPVDKYVKYSSAGTANENILDGNAFKPLTQYTFIITYSKTSGTGSNLGVWYTDGTRDNIPAHSDTDVTAKETVVLVTASGKSVAYFGKRNSSGWTNLYYNESGVFEGVLTAADFEPYQGQTYPVTLPTEAGTVYDGTVDLATQTLTVDALATDMGDLSWTYNSDGTYPFFYAPLPAPARRRATGTYGVSLCEIYKPIPNVTGAGFASEDHDHEICINSGYAGGYRVIVQDASYTDADTFAAAVSGKLLVAPLASGIEYPIDPVQISTLPGLNNIWSDTGAIAVTYPADTKTYVDDHTPVQDVQIDGTSILSNGVANVPVAGASTLGVVKVAAGSYGVSIRDSGDIQVEPSSDGLVKAGTETRKPLVPYRQHMSAFYGLAKAAGADMASSSNAVGQYTDAARIAIQKMLGVYQAPWELIRSDTVTNAESAAIEITVDGNGQSFELTDVYLELWLPSNEDSADVGGSGRLDFYYLSNASLTLYTGTATRNASAATKGAYALVENDGGAIKKLCSAYGTMGTERTNIYSTSRVDENKALLVVGNFTFIKVKISSVLGEMKYKLYGKRKWN